MYYLLSNPIYEEHVTISQILWMNVLLCERWCINYPFVMFTTMSIFISSYSPNFICIKLIVSQNFALVQVCSWHVCARAHVHIYVCVCVCVCLSVYLNFFLWLCVCACVLLICDLICKNPEQSHKPALQNLI